MPKSNAQGMPTEDGVENGHHWFWLTHWLWLCNSAPGGGGGGEGGVTEQTGASASSDVPLVSFNP